VRRAGLAATDQLERVTGQEDSHWHSRDSAVNRLEVVGLSGTRGERTAYDAWGNRCCVWQPFLVRPATAHPQFAVDLETDRRAIAEQRPGSVARGL
jgi:hypothetical protein